MSGERSTGIVCDAYKASAFRKALDAAELAYKVTEAEHYTVIKVTCDASRFAEVGKICERIERRFRLLRN